MLNSPDTVPARGVIARLPVSTIQRQFWFLDQLSPGDPSLNVPMRWELFGQVQAEGLERAFRHVIARHEILRSRFADQDGDLVQEIMDHADFRLSVIDLRTTPEAERPARLLEIQKRESAVPFDLAQTGLIRAVMVRMAADHVSLLVCAHHAVFDGFSIALMAHEVCASAAAFEAATEPDLPELPLQYGDYALWQQEMLASGVLEEERAYWTAQMKDAPYFELETDKPRPAQRSIAVERIRRELGHGFGTRLEAAARAQALSPFAFGAALVSGVLHRVSGAAEVLLTTPVSDRPDPDLERLIGPMISNQILRLRTDGRQSFTAHAAAARGVVEGAIAHQNLPFSSLVEIVNPPRDPSRAPMTSVALTLMQAFLQDRDYGPFRLTSAPAYVQGLAQDLHIVLFGRPTGWELVVEYCPDLFERGTIELLLETLQRGFEAVFSDPALPLSALPVEAGLLARSRQDRRGQMRVEQALLTHPAVASAVAQETAGGIWAYVSAEPDWPAPLEILPAALMATLAEDLRPAGISLLARLPLDSRGDVDRARLPAPPEAPLPQPVAAPAAMPVAEAAPAAQPVAQDVDGVLRALWSELLELPEPPLDRSFFDLGGHSLLAVRLMARIRRAFGISLGVATIYATPTISGLAQKIRSELGESLPQVVEAEPALADDWRIEPLKPGRDQPVVAVNDVAIILAALGHSRGDHAADCVRLFDGTRGIDQSPRSFEQIAEEYAKVVRRLQPQGPYVLFGVCVHGNIALEAARVLKAQGEKVAVVLKDVWEPGYVETLKGNARMRWLERWFALKNKLRMVREGTLSFSAMLGSYRLIRKSGVLQLAQRLRLIDRVRQSDLAPEQQRFVSYISAARNRYRPQPFDAPVLHVVTKITPQSRAFKPSVGWEDVVTGPLTTRYIDDVRVHRGQEIGAEELAREIDGFLAENGLS